MTRGVRTSQFRKAVSRTSRVFALLSRMRGVLLVDLADALDGTERTAYRWLAVLRSQPGLDIEMIDEEGNVLTAQGPGRRKPRYRFAAPPWRRT